MRTLRSAPLVGLLTAFLLAAPLGAALEGAGFVYDPETGEVVGEFVSFYFDNATGTITDYTARGSESAEGIVVFRQVTIENFTEARTVAPWLPFLPALETTAVFSAVGDHATIWAVDRPMGPLSIANVGLLAAIDFRTEIGRIEEKGLPLPFLEANNTVTYTLGPNLEATLEPAETGGPDFVQITGEAFRGYLFTTGGHLAIQEDTVIAKLEGAEATFFLGMPEGADRLEESSLELDLALRAAEGHIGARLDLARERLEGGQLLLTAFRTDFQARLRSVLGDRIVLDLESSVTAGTLVVVEIQEPLLDLQRDVRVLLDDAVLSRTASLEELIAAKIAGESDASVYLERTAASLLLVVYVPHFSTRTLVVETVSTAGPGGLPALNASLLAVTAAAAIILVAALVALRRRG